MHQPISSLPEHPSAALLYQQHAPPLFDYIRKHLASPEDAEDILVEVFVAALESGYFFALTGQEQRAWLWRVAHHKVVDAYRRGKRRRQVSLSIVDEELFEEESPGPEQVSMRQEEDASLHILIKPLSPIQQQVLRLRFANDLRCPQIAVMLGKREATVRSILARTLNRLRHLYEQQLERDNRHDATKR